MTNTRNFTKIYCCVLKVKVAVSVPNKNKYNNKQYKHLNYKIEIIFFCYLTTDGSFTQDFILKDCLIYFTVDAKPFDRERKREGLCICICICILFRILMWLYESKG